MPYRDGISSRAGVHARYFILNGRIVGTMHSSTPNTEELMKRAEDMMREDWEFLKGFQRYRRRAPKKAGGVPG